MELESIISLSISICAAIGALYTYIAHTWKLNNQQKQINDQTKTLNEYQLSKIAYEANEKKKALIEANIYTVNNGKSKSWKMRIYNKGNSKATNIRFESSDIDNDDMVKLIIPDKLLPYPSLLPQQHFELSVMLCSNHRDIHKIFLIWDDDFGKDQCQEQDISF